ncbi:MAG: cupin domain-containing protein [Bauldia litoralis]
MPDADTRPWDDQFAIEDTEIVAETPELRAVRLTLAPGQVVPWHWHSTIDDRFICLQGAIEIETRAPRTTTRLDPGNEHVVPPKVAHIVRNVAQGTSRFMVIQGIGPYDYHPVGG